MPTGFSHVVREVLAYAHMLTLAWELEHVANVHAHLPHLGSEGVQTPVLSGLTRQWDSAMNVHPTVLAGRQEGAMSKLTQLY